jgi:hypothetical protein
MVLKYFPRFFFRKKYNLKKTWWSRICCAIICLYIRVKFGKEKVGDVAIQLHDLARNDIHADIEAGHNDSSTLNTSDVQDMANFAVRALANEI